MTHFVFPLVLREGGRLSHSLDWVMVILMCTECIEVPHAFFRMAKLLNTKCEQWDTTNVSSNGKGKPCRAVTSTQTFCCKEGN